MSSRRLLAVSTLLLLVPASLLVQSDVGSATEPSQTAAAATSVSVRVTPHQRTRLEVLPQIVQHGDQVDRYGIILAHKFRGVNASAIIIVDSTRSVAVLL